jgi:hypothetical protein
MTATEQDIIHAVCACAQQLGHAPSKRQFLAHSGMTERQVDNRVDSWNEAVRKAGFQPNTRNARIDNDRLLGDWGQVVRKLREIPTLLRYRREGSFAPEVLQRRFRPWLGMPAVFRRFAGGKPQWDDVVALLPVAMPPRSSAPSEEPLDNNRGEGPTVARTRHSKLADRPTYGNPIDFRGLRHEPVNEQGVVFLFGMVAKELGYMVEAIQATYPDCEAKRQIGANKWQRVRIEFEFESTNFRDHGHECAGCDVIVCWRHNRADCPESLEVVELSSVIKTLSNSED